jgi:hypothetical protein
VISRQRVPRLPQGQIQTATLPQLVTAFNYEANAVQSMRLKLDLAGTSGGPRSGTISKLNWTVTTFLLIEKPGRVRLFGEVTLFGRVFDMASDGANFEVNLPESNKFFEGSAQATSSPSNLPPASTVSSLERIRPSVILDAMLINPIQTASGQHVMFINDYAETAAEYGVLVYQPRPDGYDRLLRRIVFSRYNLLPASQVIYDSDGLPATQATYAGYTFVQGVPVPTHITIARPEEEFSLDLKVQPEGIVLNPAAMPATTWRLDPPANATVVTLH